MLDIRAAVTDPDKAAAFSRTFIDSYLTPAFGARSKSEIDLLVFTGLIDAGLLDPSLPIYDLARALNITPARVRTLIFNWQLRAKAFSGNLDVALRAALATTHFNKDGTLMTFGIESPLLKEEVVARLKRQSVFADASFSKELVRLPVDAFISFLDSLLDDATKKAFIKRLVADKQITDTSFTAIAKGVVGKLAAKIGGEALDTVAKDFVGAAGDALIKPAADRFGDFLAGLLTSKPDDAASALVSSDIIGDPGTAMA